MRLKDFSALSHNLIHSMNILEAGDIMQILALGKRVMRTNDLHKNNDLDRPTSRLGTLQSNVHDFNENM